jgi:hypothetical protein
MLVPLIVLAVPKGFSAPLVTQLEWPQMPEHEAVVGMREQGDVVMALEYQRTFEPAFSSKGVVGETMQVATLGFARWSVRPDTLLGKPCRVLRIESTFKQEVRKQQVYLLNTLLTTYWVGDDGHILRQYNETKSGETRQTANAMFAPDGITVTVSDARGNREYVVHPDGGNAKLDAQFTPMFAGGKVLMESKEYWVLEPFRGTLEKRTAKLSGRFAGKYLNVPFRGRCFDVTTPRGTQKNFVSDQGDLIRSELTEYRAFVLNDVPAKR